MEPTVKMIFSVDMFYQDPTTPLYTKGIVYEVPKAMVPRWLKRGGQIVEEVVELPVAEEYEAPKDNFEPLKQDNKAKPKVGNRRN